MNRITVLTATAALVLTPAAIAAPAGAATLRQFEGTVTSVDSGTRSFVLRDEGRSVRIRVTSSTRYERLSGFGALRTGLRNIEASVRRVDGRWVARVVERSGRGGGSGRDDNSRGSDDSGSDDHGGRRGRGSDD